MTCCGTCSESGSTSSGMEWGQEGFKIRQDATFMVSATSEFAGWKTGYGPGCGCGCADGGSCQDNHGIGASAVMSGTQLSDQYWLAQPLDGTGKTQLPIAGSQFARHCCWTCRDTSDWDPTAGKWVGGYEWQFVCGCTIDGGKTVHESCYADDVYLGTGVACNMPCPGDDEKPCPPLFPGITGPVKAKFNKPVEDAQEWSYMELDESYRAYGKSRGLTDEQIEWGIAQLKRGCIGIASAASGVKAAELGLNCRETRAEAMRDLATLKKIPGCCPVIYGIQMWKDMGRDGRTPDAQVDQYGRVKLTNWDGQGPIGIGKGHFNYGLIIGDDTVLWADNMHNPDGKTDRTAEPQSMTGNAASISSFDAIVDSVKYNYSVWCTRCQGKFA